MSSQSPGPKRRRIAGERRPARPEAAGQPVEPTSSTPVDLVKAPPPVVPEAPVVPVETEPPARRRSLLPRRRRASRTGSGGWGGARSLAVLAAVLLALLVLSGLAAFGLLGNTSIADIRQAKAVQTASEAAPSAADRAAEAILSYDVGTLDADKDAATRFMTPTFAADYSDTFERIVKPAAKQSDAKVTADVKASAVVRAGTDKVRVLLFVDQTTVSTANKTPQLALNRVEFVMVKRGDSWLVDDITSY